MQAAALQQGGCLPSCLPMQGFVRACLHTHLRVPFQHPVTMQMDQAASVMMLAAMFIVSFLEVCMGMHRQGFICFHSAPFAGPARSVSL